MRPVSPRTAPSRTAPTSATKAALRVLAIAILLLSAAATLGFTAWIWPHPPQ